jgi:glutathione S-transferase
MSSPLVLFCAGPGFGLPEISPFAVKAEVQLKMAGLAYAKQQATPDASPKGQLPFLSDDGVLVADSTFIRRHIEKTRKVDLDAGLDARERAWAWTLERLLENHLNPVIGYARFLLPENFAKGAAHWFDAAPEAVRDGLRQQLLEAVTASMRALGPARHAPDEVVELGDRSLDALSQALGDKPYLMGDRPVAVDATAFGTISGLLTPFFDTEIRRRALRYPNLVGYAARLMKRYYPDHPWS